MQAVATVRRRAGGVKTGHAGTLDPLATGVLVLALGRATKIIDRIMRTDKKYRTTIDLSAFTTTDDREGERTDVQPIVIPPEPQIRAALQLFSGEIMQRPPAFSAMKIGGRRAYAMARKGQTVDIPPRPVHIDTIDLVSYQWPLLEIKIHCGKGTYIRSLARDIGVALGTGGHCATLRRTAVGPFSESVAIDLDKVPAPVRQSDLHDIDTVLEMLESPGG